MGTGIFGWIGKCIASGNADFSKMHSKSALARRLLLEKFPLDIGIAGTWTILGEVKSSLITLGPTADCPATQGWTG